MAEPSHDEKIIELEVEHELLLTLDTPGDKFYIELVVGSAEIFGSELQISEVYEFSYFSSVAIFTWHGCTLKLRGAASSYRRYQIKPSRQIPRLRELHEHLKENCRNAVTNNEYCPITLLTGPTDVGKSTLCRFLLNYAVRDGRTPTFVDLDVGQSSTSISGTLNVLTVCEPSDANGKHNEKLLVVYYFGYISPGHNMTLYKHIVKKIAKKLSSRLKNNNHLRTSGVLIDTCGWVDKGGYNLIKDIINMLNVTTVIVLSKKLLYHKLKNDVSWRTEVMYVNTFKDVVTRNRNVRIYNRNTSVYNYFYGSSGELQPYTIEISFNDVQIVKANYSSETSNVPLVEIEPSMLHQVLGLSYAEKIEDISLTSVYGFICIVELNLNTRTMTILMPRHGPLPTNYLLMGDILMTPR